MSYTGTLSAIIYRNEDFLIGKLNTVEDDEITITGSILGVDKGEEITVFGEWVTHPKYGKQYEVQRWERPIPTTKEQAIAFLSSPLIKGCGLVKAKQIVNHLGENALQIMMDKGEISILSIKGIGEKNAKSIIDSVRQTFEIQKIMMELLSYGLTSNMVMKAYKEFGSNTVEIIKRNPYELTKLNLVGFLKADEIAKQIGILPTSSFRIVSATDHVLNEKCYSFGHCYVNQEELIQETLKLLNHNTNQRVTDQEIDIALYFLEESKKIVIEDQRIYPKSLYQYEKQVAQKLSFLMRFRDGEAMPFSKIDLLIKEYQISNKIVLAGKQREAIRELFANNILILTGNPGTGKTTVTRAMIDIYKKLYPENGIGLAAPTGRASRKLSEVTGIHASTIHRMIELKPGKEPAYHNGNPLPYELIIVDEMSMVDIQLAHLLLDAVGKGTRLLFVGDSDQLPSVNPGNVLKDMIDSGIPHVKLTEIFRQAQESQIIVNAHRVNQGKPILVDPAKDDFYFIERETPEAIAETIRRSVIRFLEIGYKPSDILVLSPMKKGIIGTDELNRVLQETMNPPSLYKKEWQVGKTTYREGDKVIQIRNNYIKGVFNGDIGTISRIGTYIDGDGNEQEALYCNFMENEVIYIKEELNQLRLAYSITVHKSQGGQAPIVIMPVSTSHYIMLARNLIYTGMTRAEKKVVLVGTKKALNIAIRNDKITQRNTRLAERIKELAPIESTPTERQVVY